MVRRADCAAHMHCIVKVWGHGGAPLGNDLSSTAFVVCMLHIVNIGMCEWRIFYDSIINEKSFWVKLGIFSG